MSSQKESWQDFVLSSPQPCSTTKFRLAASVEVMLMMRGSPRIVLRAVVGSSRFYGMRPVSRTSLPTCLTAVGSREQQNLLWAQRIIGPAGEEIGWPPAPPLLARPGLATRRYGSLK